ncbi:MAG: Hsp33 family molecular chaperone HslO [Alphaproteobacteria bacterium]|nr:Hsp33 family molecular chaperone HslO [Alphaproteobacteria bacterium]
MSSSDISGNVIRPFQLEVSSLRGRIVRFDSVLDEILTPHEYPKAVNQLLAETITLCALLSSMLKFDGVFTLQAQGDGPISMLVADVTSKGGIRGCASFDEERLKATTKQLAAFSSDLDEASDNDLAQLLGKGHIAFTVEQEGMTERYQGIVELKGNSLVECVQYYFTQSEQIDTGIMLAVGQRQGVWRSAGLMLQHMPEEGGDNAPSQESNLNEDDWRRAMILMQSCTEEELLDPALNAHTILTRLFHEEGVRVFDPIPLIPFCKCSDSKVENVLMMMAKDDRDDVADEGMIDIKCEFCGKSYNMSVADIEQKLKQISQSHARPPS